MIRVMVCNKYIRTIQIKPVWMPDDDCIPKTRTKKPSPTNINPIANFIGVDGSIPLFDKNIHNIAKRGAIVKIKPAFKD